MELVRVKIAKLIYSQFQNGAYSLILKNEDDSIRLPIVIGAPEAQSIAIVLEDLKPARPLTHDLLKRFAEKFKISFQKVVINKFVEGVFFAELYCSDSEGNKTIIDSRTSDAVALAIRFNCPIFTTDKIMQDLGIEVKESKKIAKKPKEEKKKELHEMKIEILNEMLIEAIELEDYEYASKIRDEIESRK